MSDIAKIAVVLLWVYVSLVWIGYMWGYRRGRVDEVLGWTPPWYSKMHSARPRVDLGAVVQRKGIAELTKQTVVKGEEGIGGEPEH